MSAASDYRASISITLESPFLSQGLAVPAFGIDVGHIRDFSERPILPSAEIKGVLRHALDLLDPPADWMHERFGKEDSEDTRAWRLNFSDLVCQTPGKKLKTTRIALDDDTGAVMTGHLQVVELIAPVGEHVTFTGHVDFIAANDDEACETVERLGTALGLVYAIGAFKTAGFGRVEGRSIGKAECLGPVVPDTPFTKPHFTLSFTLDRPLLVDTEQITNNVFKGSSTIPGSVLKGALARRLEAAGRLTTKAEKRAFSRLRVGHAVSTVEGERADPVLPLSLAVGADFKEDFPDWHDAALWPDGEGAPVKEPVAYQPDWKQSHYPKTIHTEKLSRTRVKIDAERGAADDGNLFTEVGVSPRVGDRPVHWQTEITWPGEDVSDDEKAILADFCAALQNLRNIGKNNAIMEQVKPGEPPGDPAASLVGQVRIVLTTPHLMLHCDAMENEEKFHKALCVYWKSVCDDGLKLAETDGAPNVFATQTLAGGEVMRKFPGMDDQTVEPFVLMDVGSVFVLDVLDAVKATTTLSEWRRFGLPLGLHFGPEDWDKCPYLPENGYGAVAIDPPLPEAGKTYGGAR